MPHVIARRHGCTKTHNKYLKLIGGKHKEQRKHSWNDPKTTKKILKEYIDGPSKEINLINYFLRTLKRETGPIPREIVYYEVSF
jgi:hypothetical protein